MKEEDRNKLLKSEMVLDITRLLSDGRERYAKEIADELDTTSQSVSKYLKVLRESKIIERGKRTQAQYYRINYDGLADFWYNELFQALLDRIEDERDLEKNYEEQMEDQIHWADAFAFRFEELEEDYKSFATKFFELTLNTTNQSNLYDYLFRNFAISLSLSWVENNEFYKDLDELKPIRTALINYIANNRENIDIKESVDEAIEIAGLDWN
ncbi:helix-turn-helix domain-containing protein [Nanohaloarchaea archaeon]|nr:helix-turn-helix domain-containing protein [Candidatus Nanohaloarchaea archaeon]